MTFRYQAFTAPGTWTNPGTVTRVHVTVVGGGGGGNFAAPFVAPYAVGGAGGGVRKEWTDVSGPVPITIGAGGTGGPNPATTNGGTSTFGPLGPGPAPLIPAGTIAAGGGAGGAKSIPTPELPIAGGGSALITSYNPGGAYGAPGQYGGCGGKATYISTGNQVSWWGEDYYASGGTVHPNATFSATYGVPFSTSPTEGQIGSPATSCANTGAGGGVLDLPTPGGGGASPGSAGIVIVRWFE